MSQATKTVNDSTRKLKTEVRTIRETTQPKEAGITYSHRGWGSDILYRAKQTGALIKRKKC